ncbi:C39 family peptidase [Tahibacter amnicola]|uniref:C39 family peptidase n=1 Tax=Tahibacter amnicola TaxID=2976241 RepID=A0ABY6BNQ5_9GAMM|nr:C39 family peptidase [Tahibacter amnicola]UXI70196.1 C39 family peptidase [Tahibacter amnicola]
MNFLLRHALVATLALASTGAVAADKVLNVYQTNQEHSNWCWAATSVAVLNFYGKYPSQCQVVNWARGINYACGNTTFNWNNTANQPNSMYGVNGSIQSILNAWTIKSYGYQFAFNFQSVINEINGNHPFIMRYGWTSGGGHFIVGIGYWQYGSNWMMTMNPWPGEGTEWILHQDAVAAADHQWTHTLSTWK